MKDDMAFKQAVIEAVCTMLKNCFNASEEMLECVKITVGEMEPPPAQPGWTTDVNDILAYLDGVVHPLVSPENWNVYSELHDMVSALLSAQPSATDTNVPIKQPKYDEWCTDCKEYDKERHSCPRWNRVIRQTVEDMQAAQLGWTYIEEALPKTIINEHTHDYQEYNCLCDFGDNGFDVRTYKFGNGHFWNGGGIVDKYVTAWQPLPEIPDALKQKPWEGGQDGPV